jgi:translation initiation factor 1A|tara:strand:- start:1198 stop:1449 length:252 start_codon:yes stop_codon:yes gene_type:complete
MPREGEILGVVDQLLGASKMRVNCKDDKVRICRIPGKLKRRIWIRAGDIVIVKPWVVQTDKKADVVWRYTKPQVNRLQNQGII